MQSTNTYEQPIGVAVPGWAPRERPRRDPVQGRYCRIELLDPSRHADDLHSAYQLAPDGRDWTYLSTERFVAAEGYRVHAERMASSNDEIHFAVIDGESGKAAGTMALMRIDQGNGSLEVGHINFSPRLQNTRAATEAHFLMMKHAFDLGYRRYEWKCDSLNQPSRRAAARLGFHYDGVFLQAVVYKGRSRDTAWFSILDKEWPPLRRAFEEWLAPGNFDVQGRQLTSLSEQRRTVLSRE